MVGWAFGRRLADTPIWLAERFSDCWFRRPEARPAWYCSCGRRRDTGGKVRSGGRSARRTRLPTRAAASAPLRRVKPFQIQLWTFCFKDCAHEEMDKQQKKHE